MWNEFSTSPIFDLQTCNTCLFSTPTPPANKDGVILGGSRFFKKNNLITLLYLPFSFALLSLPTISRMYFSLIIFFHINYLLYFPTLATYSTTKITITPKNIYKTNEAKYVQRKVTPKLQKRLWIRTDDFW